MGLHKEIQICTQDSLNWISIVQWIPSEMTCMFRIIISNYYTNNVIITGNDDIDITAFTNLNYEYDFNGDQMFTVYTKTHSLAVEKQNTH